MYITIVHVYVKSAHLEAFIQATELNHRASIKEPGNRRFDVMQMNDDATQFILYEAYASAEDAAAHKQTDHYRSWRDSVAPWMSEPRKGVQYTGLFPA